MFFKIDYLSLWQKKGFINYLLLPLSMIWLFLAFLRNLKKVYQSKTFVICVGNLNLGGSGKTPTALTIGKLLKDKGYKVAFLTKGYKGNTKKALWVNRKTNAMEVGDEALLLAKVLPTLVARKLPQGLKIIDKEDFDIVILDDGFQNPTARKDFNILVVNGSYLFGNEMIFPAGPLRETTKSGLKKTNAVILLEYNNINFKKRCYEENINIFDGYYSVVKKHNINKKYLAFCAIGIPGKFFQTLKNVYIKPFKTAVFPDHYYYTKEDIQDLINNAQENDLQLITTSKDFIKIPKEFKNKIEVLEIDLKLTNVDILINDIVNKYEKKI